MCRIIHIFRLLIDLEQCPQHTHCLRFSGNESEVSLFNLRLLMFSFNSRTAYEFNEARVRLPRSLFSSANCLSYHKISWFPSYCSCVSLSLLFYLSQRTVCYLFSFSSYIVNYVHYCLNRTGITLKGFFNMPEITYGNSHLSYVYLVRKYQLKNILILVTCRIEKLK